MHRICPKPRTLDAAVERFNILQSHMNVSPTIPPIALIAGWVYSDDIEKMERWNATGAWARKNGCEEPLDALSESDFYEVAHLG
jgi:hypothetical protein